jgi:hypothetical protein
MKRPWQPDRFGPALPKPVNRFPIAQHPYQLSLRLKNRWGQVPVGTRRGANAGRETVSEFSESVVLRCSTPLRSQGRTRCGATEHGTPGRGSRSRLCSGSLC